jgi:zinc transport system substrate-binding protein
MNLRRLAFLLCLVSVIWASQTCRATEPIPVTVSIPPQKYFVERIGGNAVKVSVLVPPGANPATYEPKPSQMKALAVSRIYFAIGVPFERVWLKKITAVNPKIRMLHTDRSIQKLKMASHVDPYGQIYEESSNLSHENSHLEKGLDPHIWLSPALVKKQALVISHALISVDPPHKKFYMENFKAFQADLDRLDAEIRAIFARKGRANEFLVFHPSWGYFAEAYGLKQVPIEVEGKEPHAAEMARLIKLAKEKGIKVIFVQPQFSTKRAEAIAKEIGARIVIADPLREDWIQNLREVAKKFDAALR